MKTKLSVLLERLRDNGTLPKELLQNTSALERCILFYESLNKIEPFLYIRWNSQRKILSTFQKINRPGYILVCRNTTPNRKPNEPLIYEWEVIKIKRLKDDTYDYECLEADDEPVENYKDALNILFEEEGVQKKIFLSGFIARWFMPLPITNEKEALDAVFPVRRIFKQGSMYEIKIQKIYDKLINAGIKEENLDHKIFMTSPFDQISLNPNATVALKNISEFGEDIFFYNKDGKPCFNAEKCVFQKRNYCSNFTEKNEENLIPDIIGTSWSIYGAIIEKRFNKTSIKSLEKLSIKEKDIFFPILGNNKESWKLNTNISPKEGEEYSIGLKGTEKYGGILVILKHYKTRGKNAFRNNVQYTAYLFTHIARKEN